MSSLARTLLGAAPARAASRLLAHQTVSQLTRGAMLGLALEAAGRDPLVLVGGHVSEWGGHARFGAGPEAVVEADEYDRSFLQLDPTLAVVTSVEAEHLEC